MIQVVGVHDIHLHLMLGCIYKTTIKIVCVKIVLMKLLKNVSDEKASDYIILDNF